jgi:hypothetical protein
MSTLGSIGVYSGGQRFAWRGMASADYTLSSSLQRQLGNLVTEGDVRLEEVKSIREARAWGLGVQSTGHVDDLQLLSDLQHYGVATRLLDFTSNPMTALWFACQAPKSRDVAQSGLLLALNVTKLQTYSTVAGPAGLASWDAIGDPLGHRLSYALQASKPFILESANPNDRLRAQEGFFVSGAVPAVKMTRLSDRVASYEITPFPGFEVDYKPGKSSDLETKLRSDRSRGAPGALPFVAVIVRAGLKPKLLRYLGDTYNRSARTLFPDYAGFLEYGSGARRK